MDLLAQLVMRIVDGSGKIERRHDVMNVWGNAIISPRRPCDVFDLVELCGEISFESTFVDVLFESPRKKSSRIDNTVIAIPNFIHEIEKWFGIDGKIDPVTLAIAVIDGISDVHDSLANSKSIVDIES